MQQQDIGGTLSLLAPLPPEAEQFVIRRRTPKTQETDLHNGARLPAEIIEGIADKATMEIQEIVEQALDKDSLIELMQISSEAIDAEAATRAASDTTLQSNIDAEAATRAEETASKIDKSVTGDIGKLLQDFTVNDSVDTNIVLTKTELDALGSLPPAPVEMALPVASGERAGVMPKESFAQIQTNTQRIETLENKSIHYLVELATATPAQQDLQAAYETASGSTGVPFDLTTLDDVSFGKSYTWYNSLNAWQDMGSTIVAHATNSSYGIVKGDVSPGKVFVESDSSMSLNGWDSVQGKLSGIAGGATADAPSATMPKEAGTAAPGTEETFARGDHVHPATAPTPAENDNSVKIATTAFVNNWAHARRPVGEVKQFLFSPT
ncbi:MAG: hypothetical protein LBP76_10290, partial [Treponema sp.]|nr:hypothetical protein [Treponema sp.]